MLPVNRVPARIGVYELILPNSCVGLLVDDELAAIDSI
jgi:hypothetical protein